MALAYLLMLHGWRLPPFDAMLWYAARDFAEFDAKEGYPTAKPPWWISRIRFECSVSLKENAQRLDALQRESLQLRALTLYTRRDAQIELSAIAHWNTLKELNVRGLAYDARFSIADLQYLTVFVQLSSLDLSGCNITDAELQHLAGLVQLSSLNMSTCRKLTDAGLQHLAGLVQLSSLNLSGCYNFTDAGLVG